MRARVLLVEDNPDHAYFTVRAFHDAHGADVEMLTVRDGAEALDYLHRRGRYAGAPRPDLIVLDLKMPKVTGLELLARIHADDGLRSIPTVVLSSSDRREDVQASYAEGANSYVTKATSMSGLREGVHELAKYWIDVATLPSQTA